MKNIFNTETCIMAMLLMVASIFFGCSMDEVGESCEIRSQAIVTSVEGSSRQADFDTEFSETNYEAKGSTRTSIFEGGFETAIEKENEGISITFLIVNNPGCSDAVTSVDYINRTKKIVNNMSMIDWYARCKKLAASCELVTDCGVVSWHGKDTYLFTVAYNDIYLGLFYD